jgi:hypothetical protein
VAGRIYEARGRRASGERFRPNGSSRTFATRESYLHG